MWPSEGSVSEERWLSPTVWASSGWPPTKACSDAALASSSSATATAAYPAYLAEQLYNIHRYENGSTAMHLVFRDHTISDFIGFVYSGMDPGDAARHLLAT